MVRSKWLAVAALAVFAALAVAAIALIRSQGGRRSAPPAPAARNAAAPAEVTLPVQIRAQHTVTVSTPVSGNVQQFLADVGQEVYEGEPLAKISNLGTEGTRENAGAALENAQARVSKLEAAILAERLEASRARADAQRARGEMERLDKAWQRQKVLLGEGATPRLTYEKSEKEAVSARSEYESRDTLARHVDERIDGMVADLENAKKLLADKSRELDDVQEQLKAGEIVSPVNGIVLARRGEPGQPVGDDGNMELFQIAVNTALLEAVLDAEPSALARLSPGQPAMLFFADIPGEGVPGSVAEIKGNQARITFVSPSPLIKPGMTAQVRITLP